MFPGTTRCLWLPLEMSLSCARTSWLVQEDNHHTKFTSFEILGPSSYSIQETLSEFQKLAGRELEVKRIAEGHLLSLPGQSLKKKCFITFHLTLQLSKYAKRWKEMVWA